MVFRKLVGPNGSFANKASDSRFDWLCWFLENISLAATATTPQAACAILWLAWPPAVAILWLNSEFQRCQMQSQCSQRGGPLQSPMALVLPHSPAHGSATTTGKRPSRRLLVTEWARLVSEWTVRRAGKGSGLGGRGFRPLSLLGLASSLLGTQGRSLLSSTSSREEARVEEGRGLSLAVAPCKKQMPRRAFFLQEFNKSPSGGKWQWPVKFFAHFSALLEPAHSGKWVPGRQRNVGRILTVPPTFLW